MPCPTSTIIVCEPQCWGFEHAAFNAALLETVRLAEPRAKLVFMGEGTHLGALRNEMVYNGLGSEAERVQWREIAIPPRQLEGWRRVAAERPWSDQVLEAASAPDVRRLIFCSLTPTGLLWLKGRLFARRRSSPVLGVIHGILASVEYLQPRRPWHWATSLRQALRMPHPRELTYLALGPSIRTSLAEVMPQAASNFEDLDLPYFMPATIPDAVEREDPVRFGFLGVGHQGEKGFDQFVRLAQEVSRAPSLSANEFVMVGFLGGAAEVRRGVTEVVRGITRTPLSPEDYTARARQLTYAIGLAEPRHYRLVASASFLDALRYGKPGIYLRNRYLEHYFQRLGDIGYLCDSYGDVCEVVSSIIMHFPESRYRQQCENIRRGRLLFEPRSVAGRLSNILTETERRIQARSSCQTFRSGSSEGHAEEASAAKRPTA